MQNYFVSTFSFIVILLFSSFENPVIKRKATVINSIFGKKNATTIIIDKKLEKNVYYIVSGHGGPDPGANTIVDGKAISEDEYAYDVSLRLAKNLISHGATVYMIVRDENDGIREEEYLEMDKDEVVWGGGVIPLNHSQRLIQRTKIINQLFKENKAKGFDNQTVIETHVDSRYTDHKVDIFFYYNQNKEESCRLASNMFETVKNKYEEKQKGRGYTGVVKSRNLWTIRASEPPVVYVELGNIANEFDRKRLLQPANRQAIANWFTLGLMVK